MMEKQQCNIFDVVESFDVFDVVEVKVEESESTYTQDNRVVVERIITIKAEKTSRGDSKNKTITTSLLAGFVVTFVGLLADIPSAVDFVKHLLL
ncbi:hypothetical protein GE278_24335 (plasmid) [Enterobacteriaceae bacterium Kacie_13]|nr:hypothetical protein GE278_24335 [Enterobacteriaceae bacterium Kacie_13]